MIDQKFQQFVTMAGDPKYSILLLVFLVWSLIWKGIALWKSARNNQRNWFLVLLVVNTFGILEMVYIFYFSKKREKLTDQNQP